MRRNKLLIVSAIYFLLYSLNLNCQSDSTSILKQTALPLTLMATGVILNDQAIKTSIQDDIRSTFPNFDSRLDDYMMLGPTALDVAFTLTDNVANNKKHLSDILIGELAMYITTKSLKKIIGSRRPNGGGQAFPSGHTSQAFTGATLLFHHYKNERFLLASSGYLLATATGALRVLNNRHWVSDVFFGAGLGILVGSLTYHLNPIGRMHDENRLGFQIGGNSMLLTWRF